MVLFTINENCTICFSRFWWVLVKCVEILGKNTSSKSGARLRSETAAFMRVSFLEPLPPAWFSSRINTCCINKFRIQEILIWICQGRGTNITRFTNCRVVNIPYLTRRQPKKLEKEREKSRLPRLALEIPNPLVFSIRVPSQECIIIALHRWKYKLNESFTGKCRLFRLQW